MLPFFFAVAQLAAAQPQTVKLTNCQLSVYSVSADGSRATTPFLLPEHVSSVADEGMNRLGHNWRVKLTAAGAAINHRYTAEHIGQKISVMCGSTEVFRPTIAGASTDHFVITTPSD